MREIKLSKKVIVLEVSNATDEQIQRDLGQAFTDFCSKNKGTGITASVLTDEASDKVLKVVE